jgi:hypothetical protein
MLNRDVEVERKWIIIYFVEGMDIAYITLSICPMRCLGIYGRIKQGNAVLLQNYYRTGEKKKKKSAKNSFHQKNKIVDSIN